MYNSLIFHPSKSQQVFINPFGGKGRGKQLWEEQVKNPHYNVFELSRYQTENNGGFFLKLTHRPSYWRTTATGSATMQVGRRVHASCCHWEGWTCAANAPGGDRHKGSGGGDGDGGDGGDCGDGGGGDCGDGDGDGGDGDGCDGGDGGDCGECGTKSYLQTVPLFSDSPIGRVWRSDQRWGRWHVCRGNFCQTLSSSIFF